MPARRNRGAAAWEEKWLRVSWVHKDHGLLRGWRISGEIVVYSSFGKFVANLAQRSA
jgi:hypothetical protein